MARRPKVPAQIETELLTKSRRRCCLCFGLRDDNAEKGGQIAHLDDNPSNNDPDNLAWLCLDHHAQCHARNNMTKGFTVTEVKTYRERLYRAVAGNKVTGETAAAQSAELVVEFGDPDSDKTLGDAFSWDAELYEMPPMDRIPDLEAPRQTDPVLGIDLSALTTDPFNRLNRNYFRELANFHFVQRLFRRVRLVVRNIGRVAARDVRCELAIPANIGVCVMDSSDFPDAPERRSSMYELPSLKGMKPAFRQTPGDVTVDKNEERYQIEIECADLQPGRQVRSDVFYIGKAESGELQLTGHIYAENLPQPKDFTLTISASVSRTTMTVDDLRKLPEPPDGDDD